MSERIRLGVCVTPDVAAQVTPGYDFVELPVPSALAPLQDDASYQRIRSDLPSLAPPVEVCNAFVPADVHLVGPSVDWGLVETYARRTGERAAALGVSLVGFGSGGARRVPEHFSRAIAWGQLVRFLNLCADYCQPRGVTVAIEPVNMQDANFINSYGEAVQLARDVAREGVKVEADIHHYMMDGRPLDDIRDAPEWLAHVHLADTGRLRPGTGTYPLEQLIRILKDVGYEGRASIECRWGNGLAEETARSLAFLRELID